MKIQSSAAILVSLAIPFASIGAPAKANGVRGLTSSQLQRFSHDLVPSNSQDFFRQGQEQLEQEIQRLDRQPRNSKERLLKVEPQMQGDDRFQRGWQRQTNTSSRRDSSP